MSYKTILVHAEPGEQTDRRIRLAVEVAGMFDAAVLGVGAEAFRPVVGAEFAYVDGSLIQGLREAIDQDITAAHARFRDLAADVPGGAFWISRLDFPDQVIASQAAGADLVVADRPVGRSDPAFSAKPGDVVMECGCPVLLPPTGGGSLKASHVVIGWKDAREARRAIADALPFLMRAHSVHLVEINESGVAADAGLMQAVVKRLARHGVAVEAEVVARSETSIAENLESACSRHGADLLVIGAYGHSRVREWALGGVTEDLIAASTKFVLFSR
ncbi:universal stress protein UspA [Caulobacter sp. CCUG 60055]|uniref:universal stress protein n=1 Tax=Caulobacter sp. CCUG 60055 TaxID=2100090 RepID=UPI001FA78F3E|nr:universal stress protein [Caulobacter sp. CCUG 60055]MCI3179226.1 universal stress protein UspA [Caulobacter sp. CCUG 60055]